MKNKKTIIVIPARWDSTRFEGKPLYLIQGKPLLQHTFERCKQCENISDIFIATDNEKIYETALRFNARVIMTKKEHLSGTDRVWEAVQKIPNAEFSSVINVQGDEPLIDPLLIDQIAFRLQEKISDAIITVATPIKQKQDFENPHIVKVVLNSRNQALYFSRSPIPHSKESLPPLCYRHLGIYGYPLKILKSFASFKKGALEEVENLEQLRALENRIDISVIVAQDEVYSGIDTIEQARELEERLKKAKA